MRSGNRKQSDAQRDPVFVGAEAAMHRAAKQARERAEALAKTATASEQFVAESGVINAAWPDLYTRNRALDFMRKDTVLNMLRTHKATLVSLFGVTKLALFGPFARDQETDGSDIGVVVRFDSPATSERYHGVQFYLEDLLGCPVDLVTAKALRAEIRPYVEREMVDV